MITAKAHPAPIRSARTSPHSADLLVVRVPCSTSMRIPSEEPYRNAAFPLQPRGGRERYARPVTTAIAAAWLSLSQPKPEGAEPAGISASQRIRIVRPAQADTETDFEY